MPDGKNTGLTFSKGFNLPPEVLGAIGSGSYDNVELKNSGGQSLKFTRFGYGLGTIAAAASGGAVGDDGGQFDNIDVRKNRVSLNRIPAAALAGGKDLDIKLGKDKRIKITAPESLIARTSATTKAIVLTAGAGVGIIALALWATKK